MEALEAPNLHIETMSAWNRRLDRDDPDLRRALECTPGSPMAFPVEPKLTVETLPPAEALQAAIPAWMPGAPLPPRAA